MTGSKNDPPLVIEALNSEWATPCVKLDTGSAAANRLDHPQLLKVFLDGAYSDNLILPETGIVNQLQNMQPSLAISAPLANRLYLLDLIYEQLTIHSHLDKKVIDVLCRLRPTIVRSLLEDDTFVTSSKHPLRQALNDICQWGAGWDSSLGKGGESYLALLEELADAAAHSISRDKKLSEEYQNAQQALQKLSDKHGRVIERLCEAEQAKMDRKKFRRQTEDIINNQIAGRELPAAAIAFFHGIWCDLINQLLILGDEKREVLAKANELTTKILQALSPITSEKAQQEIYELIPTLFPSLKKLLKDSGVASGKEHLLDDLSNTLKGVLVGEEAERETVPVLSSMKIEGVDAVVTTAITQQCAKLKPGQWFLFAVEQNMERVKLAMSSADAGEALFVNLLGAKRFTKTMEEIGLALNTNRARLLTTNNLFGSLLTIAVEVFTKQYRESQQSLASGKTVIRQVITEEDLRKHSAEKALEEATRLSEEGNTLDQAAAALDNNTNFNRNQVGMLVKSLRIGSWLSMENRLGEKAPCKIAVVYASTGKMVIVDRSGLRVGEFLPEELADMIMNQKAEIMEMEDSFESSLSRVIKTMKNGA